MLIEQLLATNIGKNSLKAKKILKRNNNNFPIVDNM